MIVIIIPFPLVSFHKNMEDGPNSEAVAAGWCALTAHGRQTEPLRERDRCHPGPRTDVKIAKLVLAIQFWTCNGDVYICLHYKTTPNSISSFILQVVGYLDPGSISVSVKIVSRCWGLEKSLQSVRAKDRTAWLFAIWVLAYGHSQRIHVWNIYLHWPLK